MDKGPLYRRTTNFRLYPVTTIFVQRLSTAPLDQLTTLIEALLQKLTILQMLNKLPAFYRTQKFIADSYPHLQPGELPPRIPNRFNYDPFNIPPSMSRSYTRLLSFRCLQTNTAFMTPLAHVHHNPRPDHSSSFEHTNSVWRGGSIAGHFIMRWPLLPYELLPVGPKYLPQHRVVEHS